MGPTAMLSSWLTKAIRTVSGEAGIYPTVQPQPTILVKCQCNICLEKPNTCMIAIGFFRGE